MNRFLCSNTQRLSSFKPLLFSTNTKNFQLLRDSKQVAYKKAKLIHHHFPVIILVSPQNPENIGSVARSMLNFGLTDLRIVSPACNIEENMSRVLAFSAGASELINNIQYFDNLDDCLGDLQHVMATSIRPRGFTQRILTPSKAAETISKYSMVYKSLTDEELDSQLETPSVPENSVGSSNSDSSDENSSEIIKFGIMFGRESSGLTNDEIMHADSMIAIPTFPNFASLNLSNAVNIVSYEIYKAFLQKYNKSAKSSLPEDVEDSSTEETKVTTQNLTQTQGESSHSLGNNILLDEFMNRKKLSDKRTLQAFIKRLATEVEGRATKSIGPHYMRQLENIYHRIPLSDTEVNLLHSSIKILTQEKRESNTDEKQKE